MRFFALAALAASASATYTVTSKEVVTVTSCGPSVTDCPATKTPHTPVSPVVPTYAPSVIPSGKDNNGTHYTSTIFSTQIKTITQCPPTVTDCPAGKTGVTTVIVPVSTTICPITETQPTTVSTVVQPTLKLSTTPAPYPNPSKTSSNAWYGSTGSPTKPSSSLTAFTGAASHAKAGSFVAGLGVFAAFFL